MLVLLVLGYGFRLLWVSSDDERFSEEEMLAKLGEPLPGGTAAAFEGLGFEVLAVRLSATPDFVIEQVYLDSSGTGCGSDGSCVVDVFLTEEWHTDIRLLEDDVVGFGVDGCDASMERLDEEKADQVRRRGGEFAEVKVGDWEVDVVCFSPPPR